MPPKKVCTVLLVDASPAMHANLASVGDSLARVVQNKVSHVFSLQHPFPTPVFPCASLWCSPTDALLLPPRDAQLMYNKIDEFALVLCGANGA
jgi:hypothetical protein